MHNKNTIIRRNIVTPTGVHLREGDGDNESRVIAGYAILFDTPSAVLWGDDEQEHREVIAPEAITRELLDASDIKFTMFHDRQIILGRSRNGEGTLSYDIDSKGVSFELELPDSPNGDEALSAVKRGDISGCSFAFSTRYWDEDYVTTESEVVDGKIVTTHTVRQITGIYDMTLAADPAYPDTEVSARELFEVVKVEEPETPTADPARLREMRAKAAEKLI